MTERDFYKRYLRPQVHRAPGVQVFRVEDYGMPDVFVVAAGNTFYYELKVLDHLPVKAGTPFRVNTTVEQRRTLQQINATRPDEPRAFVLVAVTREKRWYLLRADAPTEIEPGDLAKWTITRGGFDEVKRILTEVI